MPNIDTNSLLFSHLAGALAACLGVVACPALAADSDAPIEELIIVGSREPVAAATLGSAVSVLDRADLEARQVPILSAILRDLPGLEVSRTGPVGSQTQIRIRGAEGNQTLVLIDGIEATDPVSNFEFDFADLLTTGIERVEVIRGPESALYGSEAIGGVISIITREPAIGRAFEGLAEGGSFGTVRLGATASAGGERGGATLSAGYYDSDGVSASPAGTERDGYRNLTLSGKLVARPRDGLTLGAVARYVDARSDFDAQDFATGKVVDADRRRAFDAFYGRVHADLALFDDIWTQTLSLALTDTANDTFADSAFVSRFAGQRWKLIYQSTVSTGLGALTAAVEHEELDFRSKAADPADPSNQKQSDDQTSFIGEWRGDLGGRAFVTVGVRRDLNGTFADATTWRATASYRLSERVRLHGSYGTGVSDPTFFDRFGFFPDFFVGNPDLRPEKARGWDAGVGYRAPDDRLRLDVTYFASELRDEITPTFDFATFLSSVENQAGVSDRQGVELSGEAQIGPHLDLRASYTFLDATEPDGSREVRRARNIASLSAVYRLPDERGELSLALDYNGRQDDLDFSTFPATRVALDDFLLATLALRYRLRDGIDLVARLENALDADYQNVLGFNTPGIGAFAGLSVRF